MTEPSTHRVLNEGYPGTSLAGQRLGLSTLTGVAPGSIPGWKIKMPQAVWHGQKKKKNEDSSKKHTKKQKLEIGAVEPAIEVEP